MGEIIVLEFRTMLQPTSVITKLYVPRSAPDHKQRPLPSSPKLFWNLCSVPIYNLARFTTFLDNVTGTLRLKRVRHAAVFWTK